MKRIKYGSSKYMTEEELKEHTRQLHRNWCKKHPEWVKSRNRHYFELYKETKPCVCVCVKCGKKFNAPRKYYKMCEHCVEKWHKDAQKRREAISKRRIDNLFEIQEILRMAHEGWSQTIIAETFGRSQSGISTILRKNGIKRQEKRFFDRHGAVGLY